MTLASSRFDGLEAPGHVLLSEELVNTKRPRFSSVPDLLGDSMVAQEWLDDVVAVWARETGGTAPMLHIDQHDVRELRELRAVVEATIARDDALDRPLRGAVQLSARAGGSVAVVPVSSTPAAWLEASVLAERLRAEVGDTWGRLKICANPDCRVAFYDRSRNRSGLWHSVERCGNKINLRNLRARRSLASGPVSDPS